MNVTTEILSNLTGLLTSVFTSLVNLISSPLGGLITFGLALGYLYKIKRYVGVQTQYLNGDIREVKDLGYFEKRKYKKRYGEHIARGLYDEEYRNIRLARQGYSIDR